MRFALATLALAASASASIIARQTIPSCANDCLFGPDVDLDGCNPTDNVCLCKSQPFVSKSTTCIEGACSGNDLQTALTVAQELCASVGVTLTSSAPAPTASSDHNADSPAPSSADSASTPAASSPKPTSTAPTSSKPSSAPGSSTAASAPTFPSASAPATTSNAATLHSVNAFAGLAAVGLAALAL